MTLPVKEGVEASMFIENIEKFGLKMQTYRLLQRVSVGAYLD
jgi:hypothetical protein